LKLARVDCSGTGAWISPPRGPIFFLLAILNLQFSVGRFSIPALASKEYKIALSDLQRRALLRLLGEAEARLNLKELLPDHEERAGVYKAMKKLRNALPRRSKLGGNVSTDLIFWL